MATNTISMASNHSFYYGSPAPQNFKFTATSSQPITSFQVIEGTGTSSVDISTKQATYYLPVRTVGTPGAQDDFEDLHDAVPNGTVHPTFSITYDTGDNHITSVSWTV